MANRVNAELQTNVRLSSLAAIITLLLAATASVQSAAASESSGAAKRTDARKSAGVEFSASRQSVGGHEIAGFSARQARTAQKETLTPPAGLKPVEQEAWLAMARRQGARGGMELASFYPERYGEAFVVEGEGVRVAVRPVGGTDVRAQIDNGQVIYRRAYPETDSVHVVSAGRSEEFLFLQNECAPREFAYELSELSAGTRVELVKGEVHFSNKAGQGVKIEAPWLIEATGERRAGAVRWELEESKGGASPRLRLVVAEGLSYPVLIDPSWVTTGSLVTARYYHTATLLSSGKVLVAGGFNSSNELSELSAGTRVKLVKGEVRFTNAAGHGVKIETPWLIESTGERRAGAVRWELEESKSGALPRLRLVVAEGLSYPVVIDPSWVATGSLGTARSNHTAT
ncbi:MAG TPA: hypothetical protein VE176_15240, partial [Candidatus Limnocylindrales bacterium]|nr:hypothetical protein [Candidatus Limnocylindrales bacterium]